MPTPTKGTRFGGSPSHQRLILANLASQLFEHGRITTTEAKAKRLRPLAETLITKAKRGDIQSRRQVLTTVRDKSVVHTLFTEIGPSFEGREGGYTRITKVGPRKGDNAPMAVIELVTETMEETRAAHARRASAGQKSTAKKRPAQTTTPAPASSAATTTPAATPGDPAEPAADESAESTESTESTTTYGAGSFVGAEPPAGFVIKGNEDSMKFHTPESQWYDQTIAEVWFETEAAAEAAGFTKVE